MVLKVLIDEIEYTADTGYSITDLAGAVGSADLVVLVPTGTTVPRTFASCQILADDVPLFWGIISSVSSPAWSSGAEVPKYSISVQAGESLFNNRLVSEAYVNQYTHEIIADLFENYIAAEGLTLGQIDTTTQQYDKYNCSYTPLSQVLSELADEVGFTYYVSADKKFYFISRTSFTQIPAPAHITKVKLEEESGDIRTRQIVTGATEETATQTEGVYWAADQTVMPLGYQIGTITGITINNVSCGFGILGVDDEDPTKTFLYNSGGQQLTLNSYATTKPATGDNVVCVYRGYFDVVVENDNSALISEIQGLNGTSGLIEKITTDTTITTYTDAETKCQALLSQYGDREQTISCDARELADTERFMLWAFNLPDQNIVGDYAVVERTIKAFGVDSVWISVKLKNKNFFARYGTTLITKTKTAGQDAKVYKNISVSESVDAGDSFVLDSAGIVFYPSPNGGVNDPGLPGFYPI